MSNGEHRQDGVVKVSFLGPVTRVRGGPACACLYTMTMISSDNPAGLNLRYATRELALQQRKLLLRAANVHPVGHKKLFEAICASLTEKLG